MGRPRLAREVEAKERERLTQLALQIYLQDGLEALSFRRLAELAGVSHMYPYRFFDNKDALIVSLRLACSQHFVDAVLAADKPEERPVVRLLAVGRGMLRFALSHRSEYDLVFSTPQPKPDQYPQLLAVRETLLNHVTSIAEAGVRAGEIRGTPPQLAQMMWAGQHGLISLHFSNQLVHGSDIEALYEPMLLRLMSGGLDKP